MGNMREKWRKLNPELQTGLMSAGLSITIFVGGWAFILLYLF